MSIKDHFLFSFICVYQCTKISFSSK